MGRGRGGGNRESVAVRCSGIMVYSPAQKSRQPAEAIAKCGRPRSRPRNSPYRASLADSARPHHRGPVALTRTARCGVKAAPVAFLCANSMRFSAFLCVAREDVHGEV